MLVSTCYITGHIGYEQVVSPNQSLVRGLDVDFESISFRAKLLNGTALTKMEIVRFYAKS